MISELFSGDWSWWVPLLQSTVCMMLGIVGSFLFKRRAARAHQVLMLGIIVSLFVPVLSVGVNHYGLGLLKAEPLAGKSALRRPAQGDPTASNVVADEAMVGPMMTGAPLLPNYESLLPSAAPGPSSQAPFLGKTEATAVTRDLVKTISWAQVLMCIWGLGSLVLFLRLIRTFILGIRLLRRAEPLDNVELTETMFNACSRLGVRHNIDIRVSPTVHSPIIWCWGVRPILLVPTSTDNLTRHTDWLGLFCHEVAHWKRRDHVVGLATELAVSLIWWHPLLWWAKQRLLSLSEQACDDWVLASGQAGPDYAELLLNLLPEGRMAFVPTVVGKENTMKARIHRIIKHPGSNPRVGWTWALIALLITLSVAIGTALAQRRPARVAEHEQQERLQQHEELRETIHYLETRIKMNQKEIQGLEQDGRGQGVKARILRDEVRGTRERLGDLRQELRASGGERDLRHPTGAQHEEHLQHTTREREELAQRAKHLEQELRALGDGNPKKRKELRFELQNVHQRLAHMSQDLEHRSEQQAEHQGEHHELVHNLLRERDELAKRAEGLERELREIEEEGSPDRTEKLHRDLAEAHKHLQQMNEELGQQGSGHETHQAEHAEHQKAHQAHLHRLRNNWENIGQKAERLERRLHELGDRDPDQRETLHRELEEMRKQQGSVVAALKNLNDPDLLEEPMHEPGARHDRLQEIRELEEMAKHQARELLELDEQDRGNSDEARVLQKRLQGVR